MLQADLSTSDSGNTINFTAEAATTTKMKSTSKVASTTKTSTN